MNKIVSLEIGKDVINAAEIHNPGSKNPKVVKVSQINLPSGIVGESVVHNTNVFVESLTQLWSNAKFSTKNVALVVAGRRFIVRQHVTSHTSMKDLMGVIRHEASAVIPDQLANPVVDFYPMYHTESRTGIQTTGLVIATSPEPIETIIGALIKANLKIEYVDYAPMALARFVDKNLPLEEANGYAILNIREDSSDLLVSKNNVVRYVRIIGNGLPPVQKKKGRHQGLPDISLTGDFDVKAIDPPDQILLNEVSKTLEKETDELQLNLRNIYVAGTRSEDEEFLSDLNETLKLKAVGLTTKLLHQKNGLEEELEGTNFVAICAGMRGKK